MTPLSSPASRNSLRATLAIVVLLAIAPIAALLAWQVYGQLRSDRERTQEELRRAAADFAQAVDREIASSVDALTVLSQSEIFQRGRIAAMGRLLQGRPRRDWDSIFLLDAQGAVVLDTAPHPGPPEPLRSIGSQVMKKLAPVVGGEGSVPGISIAMPILQGGHVIYVLGVRMNDAMWPRLASNARTPEGGQAQLYDAHGRLIGESGNPPQKFLRACAEAPVPAWRACVSVQAGPIEERRREQIFDALSTSGVALLAGLVLAVIAARLLLARSG